MYFVGGYFETKKYIGEKFESKIPYGNDIEIYTLDEALNLNFIETIKDFDIYELSSLYKDVYKKDLISILKRKNIDIDLFTFNDFTDKEKKDLLLEWCSTDEIAGLEYFKEKKDAINFKNEVLKENEFYEKNSTYIGKQQNKYGYFIEVYSFNY